MKEFLLCPGCGRKVKFEELKGIYEKDVLIHYEFLTRRCYKCKKIAEFDKDYTRYLWQEQHPTLKVVKKL